MKKSENRIKAIKALAKKEKRELSGLEKQEIAALTAKIAKIKAMDKGKKTLVEFIKSPTALFKLGYSVGDKVELPIALAAELIEANYARVAVDLEAKAKEDAEKKAKEDAEKKAKAEAKAKEDAEKQAEQNQANNNTSK